MEFENFLEHSFDLEAFTSVEVGNRRELNWVGLTNGLKEYFRVDLLGGINPKFSEINVRQLLEVLTHINGKFSWYNSLEAPIQECLTETLKIFRVYVTRRDVARYVLNDSSFFMVMSNLMQCVFTKKNGQELYTKYLLQFILNLISVVSANEEHTAGKERIREAFLGQFTKYFLGCYGHIYESSAVLYNLLRNTNITDKDLIEHIILCHADVNKSNEYLDFLMQNLISSDFLWQIYEELNVKTRLALLRCLREVLISPSHENILIKLKALPLSCLDCFIAMFNKSAAVVFQVTQAGSTSASQEVALILEIFTYVSIDENSLEYLQNNQDIFINAGMLLLNIHRLGQMSDSVFTPIQKLSQNKAQSDGETRNPVFGFKADLVRLIGNLCWKNKRIQDLARVAEVIPVLLDCCNIDGNNPFIIQWVILAIRNICENNRENQAVIAGLKQQGVINPDLVQQFGVTLHSENDLHIGLLGLDLNK